ncbi:hypothetical protein [Allokutzneria albata]|uniref:hypothetical protein n=1 Tax=Allokutzneria albata TaxID=211114 RepID=UPI00138E0DCF|nr:hypothetical protein [Allokutzneria albata]
MKLPFGLAKTSENSVVFEPTRTGCPDFLAAAVAPPSSTTSAGADVFAGDEATANGLRPARNTPEAVRKTVKNRM